MGSLLKAPSRAFLRILPSLIPKITFRPPPSRHVTIAADLMSDYRKILSTEPVLPNTEARFPHFQLPPHDLQACGAMRKVVPALGSGTVKPLARIRGATNTGSSITSLLIDSRYGHFDLEPPHTRWARIACSTALFEGTPQARILSANSASRFTCSTCIKGTPI